ncbi:hypothetical protein D3C77_517580 [compost metagenome]
MHHRRSGKHVAHFDFSVEQTGFERAAQLAEVACRVAVAVDWQHVERTAATTTAIAAVELERQHDMGIDPKTDGALRVTRLETDNERLGPGLGITGLASR